jgi:hypothetical protein
MSLTLNLTLALNLNLTLALTLTRMTLALNLTLTLALTLAPEQLCWWFTDVSGKAQSGCGAERLANLALRVSHSRHKTILPSLSQIRPSYDSINPLPIELSSALSTFFGFSWFTGGLLPPLLGRGFRQSLGQMFLQLHSVFPCPVIVQVFLSECDD